MPQPAGQDRQDFAPKTDGALPAVFLHTGWRSGGTWLWSRCRVSARVQAFYEPLHEQMATLNMRRIMALRPGSWVSHHSETAPYFQEYRGLISTRGRGVEGYQARFAFDSFFLSPADADDGLRDYIGGLMAGPAASGEVGVFKFCRSLGRVGWFEAQFPSALHAVVLRDPLGQWQSSQRLLREQRNRYFAVAPILVLARNAGHERVREAAEAMRLRLPRLASTDMAYGLEVCARYLRGLDDAARYRAFLAFWTASTIAALESRALVLETSRIVADTACREAAEAMLRARIGETICLQSREAPVTAQLQGAALTARDIEAAHLAAGGLAYGYRATLAPGRLELILGRLSAEPSLFSGAMARPPRCVAAGPLTPAAEGRRLSLPRVPTAGLVVMARVLHRMRRLHGAVVWHGRRWAGMAGALLAPVVE